MPHKDLDGVLEKFSIGDELLLGAGAESRVYALGDDLVLRVYRGAAGANTLLGDQRMDPASAAIFAAFPEVPEADELDDASVSVARRWPTR